MGEVIIQGDIEAQILRLVNELEEETSVYASQIEEAARADITYKREFSRAQVMLAADQPKLTVATREAKAMQMAMDEMAVAKILAARVALFQDCFQISWNKSLTCGFAAPITALQFALRR